MLFLFSIRLQYAVQHDAHSQQDQSCRKAGRCREGPKPCISEIKSANQKKHTDQHRKKTDYAAGILTHALTSLFQLLISFCSSTMRRYMPFFSMSSS